MRSIKYTMEKTMSHTIVYSIKKGIAAVAMLFVVYGIIVTLVSGLNFATTQFLQYWYFIISLAIGFGIQIGCYAYLKKISHHEGVSKGVVVGTGTTSTFAMISCCAHYLVNIIPALGAFGIATVITKYQIEFFWVGIVFNMLGIVYMIRNIKKITKKI